MEVKGSISVTFSIGLHCIKPLYNTKTLSKVFAQPLGKLSEMGQKLACVEVSWDFLLVLLQSVESVTAGV